MNAAPVLYAEDEENDVFLLRRAFVKARIPNPLEVVTDGREAIEYLGRVAAREKTPFPCIILLDLKMPLKNGFEVLEWLRKQSAFRTIPVLALTSSAHERDVHKAYLLGANAYLVKPRSPEHLLTVAERVRDFWLSLNINPPDPLNVQFKDIVAIPRKSEQRPWSFEVAALDSH